MPGANERGERVFAALICANAALPQLGIALTLASLPAMRVAFDASVEQVQLTISAYFLCLAAMQLPYGILSDRYGRRPLLIVALGLFGMAGAAAALVSNLYALIGLRALQGMGAGGCNVLSRAIITDAYPNERAVRMMTIAMTAPALVSLFGPLVGGWLAESLEWRGALGVIAVIGLTVWLGVVRFLPETRVEFRPDAPRPRVLRSCVLLLTTPASVVFTAIAALCTAGMYAYSAISAFVLMEVFGVPRAHYGWFLAMTGTAMIAGSWTTGFIPLRRRKKLLAAVALLAVAAALTLLAGALSGLRGIGGLVAVMAPMVVYAFCVGIFTPTMTVAAIQQVPGIGGLASAVSGSIMSATGGLLVWLGGRLYDGTPAALGICIALVAALWTSLYLTLARRWLHA